MSPWPENVCVCGGGGGGTNAVAIIFVAKGHVIRPADSVLIEAIPLDELFSGVCVENKVPPPPPPPPPGLFVAE